MWSVKDYPNRQSDGRWIERDEHRILGIVSSYSRLFDGTEIMTSTKYKIEAKGNLYKLTIPKAELTDSGSYTVIATNGLDTIQAQSKLDVSVKPKLEGR